MSEDWTEKVPSELVKIIQHLLPLYDVVVMYRDHVRRLELEVLTMGNLLLEKGITSKEELEEIQKRVMEMKREEYEQAWTPADEVNRGVEKARENSKQVVEESPESKDELRKRRVEERAQVEQKKKSSGRLPPVGHNVKR